MLPQESSIVSLCTGIEAPPDVSKYLLRAEMLGEERHKIFKETRLEEDSPTINIFDKITKLNLKTLSSICTKKTHKCK